MDTPNAQSSDPLLTTFLDSNDAPCPVCDYNLRGVVLATCPECDAPIELAVGSAQARLGPWLMAWLAFAMALGFDAIIGAMTVITGGEASPIVFLAGSLVLLGVLSAVMLRVLVVRKRSWLSMTRRNQWIGAWTIFAGVFFVHLGVGIGFVLLVI